MTSCSTTLGEVRSALSEVMRELYASGTGGVERSVMVRWMFGEESKRGARISWPMKPPAPVMRICCADMVNVVNLLDTDEMN